MDLRKHGYCPYIMTKIKKIDGNFLQKVIFPDPNLDD